jgi:hypothetical protein
MSLINMFMYGYYFKICPCHFIHKPWDALHKTGKIFRDENFCKLQKEENLTFFFRL